MMVINYCGYRREGLCINPDGKIMICPIDIDSIYEKYAKENAVRMCSKKQKWDSKKLETKVI